MPEQIFVSYSHLDKEEAWFKTFWSVLDGGLWATFFHLWRDKRIQVGEKWTDEIESQIVSARLAILLESANFARSDYIAENELPAILKRRHGGALTIVRIPCGQVPPKLLGELYGIEAAWDPGRPLDRMSEEELRAALATVGEKLIEKVQGLTLRDDLSTKIERVLDRDTTLGEPLATGEYSVFYKAKRFGADIAIKAVVPSPSRQWLSSDFLARAEVVRHVTNATAIGIRDVIPKKEVQFVVTEFVAAPTLKMRLEKECLTIELVADVMAQLVRLADHLHSMDGQPTIGPIQPSHVHYIETTRRARVSLISIANETLKSCQEKPIKLIDSEALTYLSPERYGGRTSDVRTDQYHIALLGLELLEGTAPVRVETFADMERKREFFARPRKFFGARTASNAAMSFVLSRMLERDPDERWQDMSDLFDVLTAIAKREIPKAIRNLVARDYTENLRNNEKFFETFYDILFRSSEEIQKLFGSLSKAEQARKLNGAMANIINFEPGGYMPTLVPQVQSHRELRLTPEHFSLFRTAFLRAIREIRNADERIVDAWRAVLEPALTYMREQVCGGSQDIKSEASSPSSLGADLPADSDLNIASLGTTASVPNAAPLA